MKKNSALKLTILIVCIILISLISFVGIYKLQGGMIKNIMPDYLVSKELNGTRLIKFVVDDSTKEVESATTEETTEEASEETSAEDETEEQADENTETVPVNSKEVLTAENYELSKNIIQKRLNQFNMINYDLRVDTTTGDIALEVPENSGIDDILGYLLSQGTFKIIDTETEEVLLDNSNIEEAKTMYYTDTTGTTVYLNIVFNDEGKQKLEEISKTYVETTDEEGNSTTKTITIKLDDETITTTYFGQTMSNGELPLTIGSPTTDSNTLQNYFVQSGEIAIVLNNGIIPIVYDIGTNEYVAPVITQDILNKIILAAIIILALMVVYLIIRHRTYGIISALSIIGYIALYLIVVRFTDTIISLEAMAAIGIAIILEFIFVQAIAKKLRENSANADVTIKKELIKNISLQIPMYIMAVVFVFVEWETIKSFGIALFWGLIISLIYNFVFTRLMFIQRANMKK